jgi:hypothetical protein
MVHARALAMLVVLSNCGGAATAAPAQPPANAGPPRTAALPRAPQADALHGIQETLQGAGHGCHMVGETLVCDDKNKNEPTVGIVYGTEASLGPYLGFVASFNWKDPTTGCANATKKINELNAKFDLLHASCTSENMVFALTAPIGELGFTSADVRGLMTYFQSLVSTVLRSDAELLGTLK